MDAAGARGMSVAVLSNFVEDHREAEEIETLCRDFPGTALLVDHFGGTGAATPFSGAGWQRLLAVGSRFDNAYVKCSGWHPHATPSRANPAWQAKTSTEAAGEATLELMSHFTADRLLFGSNFPIGGGPDAHGGATVLAHDGSYERVVRTPPVLLLCVYVVNPYK